MAATNQKTTTGASYTYTFKTATTATIKSITMTVPPGTSGPAGRGTITSGTNVIPVTGTMSGPTNNVVTYTFAAVKSVTKTKTVSIQVTGLTNTSAPGSYTAQITTVKTTGAGVNSGITGALALTGTLTSPTWSVSNSTKSTAAAYTYSFTTGSAGVIKTVTMTVPTGTTKSTLAVGSVSGIGAGTVTLTGTTLTYTVTSPTLVAAGTAVSITVTGFVNTTTPKNYTSTITTKTSIASIDVGTTPNVAIVGALTTARWTVSNPVAGTSGVTYTYSFKTADAGVLKKVTMTVPAGTGKTTLGLGTLNGISTGTPTLTGTTLTFTVATAATIAKTTPVTIPITGLVNTSTSGSYTSTIATSTATTPVDTGTTATVAITGTTLTNPSWTVSTAVKSTAATYTYTFTTTTTATIKKITMTVPTGTTGTTLTPGTVSGINTGTAVRTGTTVTYTVGTVASVPAGTTIVIPISGLTNTATVGTNYSSTITTHTATAAVDSGITTPSVAIVTTALKATVGLAATNQKTTTGASYTYTFKTATTATIKSITMTVPPGTSGPAGRGTITSGTNVIPVTGTMSGPTNNVVTYTFAAVKSVTKTKTVSIQVTGLTNTSAPGSYTAQITTVKTTGAGVNSGITGALALTGTLTSPTWSVSNSTKSTAAAYTYSFTTGSAGVIKTVTMTVPTGTTKSTLAVGSVSGIGAGTVTLTGTTLTYTVTSPTLVAAGTAVSITVTGFVNTTTPKNYTSTITTKTSIASIDVGTTPNVAIVGALTTARWTVSNPVAGTSGVTYTYSFKTADAGVLKKVTMTVPAGTGKTTLGLGTLNGISTGTPTLTGTTLTFTVATAATIAKTTPVTIPITGLVNTSTSGSYTSTIATSTATTPVDTGTTATVAITPPLTTPLWATSNATKGASATYTYSFKTQGAATISKVTMTVPTGTSKSTLGTGTLTGIGAGTVTLTGTTLTFTVASPVLIPAHTAVSIPITGLINTSTPGNYTSTITTKNGTAVVDSGVTPSVAIVGALTTSKWTVSNPVVGASGVTYTYSFKTADAATLKTVTMTVPTGTSKNTLGLGTLSGISTGTPTLTGTTLTFTVASPALINTGTTVTIPITGLVNTSTSGSYTSTITTSTATTPVDTGTTASVGITPLLTSPLWATSSNLKGGTGVTYTYSFTTQAAATVSKVTMTVPTGTSKGTLGLGTVSGIGTGTPTLTGTTLTYTVTLPALIPAHTAVSIPITGLINTSTAGNYTSTITTKNGTAIVDSGITPSVALTTGALTSLFWSASSSATSASSVTYNYGFKTTTAANVTSVTMRLPSGTGGTPALGTVSAWHTSKVTIAGQAISRSGTTLVFSFTSRFFTSNTFVYIQIAGLTNTSTTGNYTSTITSKNGTTPVDTGTAPAVVLTSTALTGPFWTPSSTQTSATAVSYSYGFTAATTSSLSSVTMSVPPGTTGTPTVGTVTPSSVATGGHVSLSGQLLTYTFTSVTVNAGTVVRIQITGLKNTTVPASYSEQMVTKNGSSPVNAGSFTPRAFTATALKTLSWTASSTKTGGTGSAYTFDFTENTAQWIKTITMSVPPGTSGTPAVGSISAQAGYAITMKTPTVSLSGDTLTFSFTGVYFQANTVVSIQITGLKNTTTSGAYQSSIVTFATPTQASSVRPPVNSGPRRRSTSAPPPSPRSPGRPPPPRPAPPASPIPSASGSRPPRHCPRSP